MHSEHARLISDTVEIHTAAQAKGYREKGWWRDSSLLDDFMAAAARSPDKVALVCHSHDRRRASTMSYGQLARLVDRCACAFIGLGIAPGDIISLQLPNDVEMPILALAAMRAGAIPNPIPPIYRETEVSFMLQHARSKLFVVPDRFRSFAHADLARKLKDEFPSLEHVFVSGAGAGEADDLDDAILSHPWELVAGLREELDRRRPDADDIAVLLFTSGTTGTPKAALHSHNTIRSAGQPLPASLELTADDVCFMASTLGHLTGFYWGMLLPLSMGQKVVYQDIWDPARMPELIEGERIGWTLSATPFAMDLVEASKQVRRDLSSLRAFACGGAPIPPQVAIDVNAATGANLISLWGCTEVGICSIHKLGAPLETLAASDGMQVDRMELRIVDEDFRAVPEGEEGRLQVRGPGIFLGYLRQPERTAEMCTPDGWYDTGDRGRRVADGGIRISGRTKDIIIRGGQNVPVVEIENALQKMPNVRDVAVIGIPDPRLGERGCAVIVAEGTPPTLDEVRARLTGMSKQFWPEYLEIVESMPRTPAGKIQKFELRKRFEHLGQTETQA